MIKKIINALTVASVVVQGAVVNGREVLGITLDRWWNLSVTLWMALTLFLAFGVPTIILLRRVAAYRRLEASRASVVGR
jgi:hypothetical protein